MILFLDVDGTILNDNQSIGTKDFEAIAQIKASNKVILISARKPSATLSIAKQLGIEDDVVVCYNGALLLLEGKVLSECTISNQIIHEIYRIANDFGVSINVYWRDQWLTNKMDKYVRNEATIIGELPQVMLSFPKSIEAHKILIMCNDYKAETVVKSLHSVNEIAFNKSKKGYIEITSQAASKENAFCQLLGFFNVPKSETIAIGDGYNDLLLLKNAAIGVAMQNAVDEVKKVADFVTLSNNDNGVAFAISHYMKYFCKGKHSIFY